MAEKTCKAGLLTGHKKITPFKVKFISSVNLMLRWLRLCFTLSQESQVHQNEPSTVPAPFLVAIYIVLRLVFDIKNKIKAHPSYENKQGARSITEGPEMERVRYIVSYNLYCVYLLMTFCSKQTFILDGKICIENNSQLDRISKLFFNSETILKFKSLSKCLKTSCTLSLY